MAIAHAKTDIGLGIDFLVTLSERLKRSNMSLSSCESEIIQAQTILRYSEKEILQFIKKH